MGKTFFIFLMIFIFLFYFFNKKYEKKHDGKTFLQENKKTEKVFKKVVLADDVLRVSDDLSKISNYGLFL